MVTYTQHTLKFFGANNEYIGNLIVPDEIAQATAYLFFHVNPFSEWGDVYTIRKWNEQKQLDTTPRRGNGTFRHNHATRHRKRDGALRVTA